jgi:hypothetical protein
VGFRTSGYLWEADPTEGGGGRQEEWKTDDDLQITHTLECHTGMAGMGMDHPRPGGESSVATAEYESWDAAQKDECILSGGHLLDCVQEAVGRSNGRLTPLLRGIAGHE